MYDSILSEAGEGKGEENIHRKRECRSM